MATPEGLLPGIAGLGELYGAVGRLIGEVPLTATHRAKVRQVVGREPTIIRLGHGQYGRIQNPATGEQLPAPVNPATGRKVDPYAETEDRTSLALPNQAVLDDLVESVEMAAPVEDASYAARVTPIGQGPTRRMSEHHFYDMVLFDPGAGMVVEMEDLEGLLNEQHQLDTANLGRALGEATAKLMQHGYSGATRVSVAISELIMYTDVGGETSYFWSDDRKWVTVTYADNPRIAASQLQMNLEGRVIENLPKYMKSGVGFQVPVAVSFVVRMQ